MQSLTVIKMSGSFCSKALECPKIRFLNNMENILDLVSDCLCYGESFELGKFLVFHHLHYWTLNLTKFSNRPFVL